LTRYASGQSASAAIAVKPFSRISRFVSSARIRSCVPCVASPRRTKRASPIRLDQRIEIGGRAGEGRDRLGEGVREDGFARHDRR
jgi:hypothetical protein